MKAVVPLSGKNADNKINILGFANYMVSVAIVHLCRLRVKASIDNKSRCGGGLIKLNIPKIGIRLYLTCRL